MSSGVNIMCVEDETLLLNDLVEELGDAGYTPIPARNGQEALELLKHVRPDIILCDIMMPEMDGPTLLKQVRETLPGLDPVPFIFLTARASRDDIIEGKRLGADDYLTKPVDFDLLLATLETRLAGVKRTTERARQQLTKLYKAYQNSCKEKPPIKVSIVTANRQTIAPIGMALTEVGCRVTVIPEENLKADTFTKAKFDINFFVYSKKVHLMLEHLATSIHVDGGAKAVVLVPATMSDEAKEGLLRNGVDHCIEFPFRPVEVFKVIVDRLSQGIGVAATPARTAAARG